MQDAATIVATRDDYLQARDAIVSLLPTAVVQGEPARWKSIVAEVEGGTITFNSLAYTGPMDQYSRILMPLTNRFDEVRTNNKWAKERALGALDQCDLMIGVTASPSFEADPRFPECLAVAAEAVNGLIFTGEALVEPRGRLVLSFSGQSEL